MSKFLSGLKALVCAVAALTCGGAWAGDLVWESFGTALLGKDSYTSLGWQVSDIATLKTYKFWGAIGGGNVNSQQYKGAIGYDATDVQDGSDSVLAVDMRAIDDNYVKSVLVYLKIDNGVVQAKAAQVSWKSGGTITTQYVNPSTLQPQNDGSVADPVTSNGSGGYGLATLRATTETEFPLEVGPLGRNTSSTFGKEQKQSSRSHYMLSRRLVPGSGNIPYTTYGTSFPSSSFTVSTYVNIDAAKVPENKSAVIWSYGGAADTPTPKLILTVIPGGKIKLYNFEGNTLDESKTLTSASLTGWHLVTVTFDATSGSTMTIDTGSRQANATMTHTPGKDYQLASIHGGVGISDNAFTNSVADQIFIEDILVFDGVLSESRVTSLSAAYPKDDSTRSYTISSSIADGTKKVYKGGSDTVTLSAANSHSGGTEIFGGTLKMGNNSALGGEGRKATVHFGATLDLAGNNSYKLWPTLDGGTLASSTGDPSYGNTMMAGMTLTADSTVDISGTRNGIVTNGYNATTIDLAGHKLTKTGSGEFCLAKVTLTAGTLRIEDGTVRQFHGNNGESTPGYDNNGQGDFSAAKVEIVGEGTKVVGSYTQTFKEIDLTEFTGSTAPFEKLTVTADTIWHFPSTLEENAPLTICTSALTAAQTTVSNVRAYVGSAAKLVNLTYNTANKSVSYALVRDMLYCFHLDGNTDNAGIAGTANVTVGSSVSYQSGAALGDGQYLVAGANSFVKVYNADGLVSNDQGWSVSFWVESEADGVWQDHAMLFLGDKHYSLRHAASNKKVNIYPGDTTVADNYQGIALGSDSVWHNIVLVSSGEDVKIYKNGQLDSTYRAKEGQHLYGTGFAGLTGFTIGRDPECSQAGTTKTDEVAIYSAALTENEVAALAKIKPINVVGKVAIVGTTGYATIAEALEAAAADDIVTLCANATGGLTIPANKKVDAGAYTIGGAIEIGEGSTLTMTFTNERVSNGISGRGTLILNGTGTLDAKNKSSGYAVDGTTIQINAGTFKFYTGTNGGYSSGASDATTRDATFEIGASGNIANYGWVNFVGDLTFSYSGGSEKSVFGGVSFRGKPNLIKDGSGTLNFNASPNDANSDCFASVAIKAGTLKVRNNIVALPDSGSISGPGTLDADLTFADGASVNLNTDALTLGSGRTLRFGASINLVKTEDIADDTVILQGLSSEIAGLSLVDVTVNGAAVENGRLYYDNGAIKYTVAAAETWTPNTAVLAANKILDWTAENAWINANGAAATWIFSESATKPNVQIDATKVKGVKIAGQVYVGTVVVSGTLGAGESFQFYSSLYSSSSDVTVDGTHEVDDTIDCLHTEGVNLASLNGELGMKVPITGPIAFGSNTRLVFATGSKGGDASKAYGYTFVDRGGYITVRGAGKFIVPSSMQALAFSIEETATAIYRGPGDDTIGTLTGTGTIELQNGKTLALNPASGQTLHYVSAGTTANKLSWVGNGNTAISNNDSKEKPLVRVESGATLNIYGHDYAGWNGKLGNHSWFVNNGTIVFQRDGDNSRFWRDHIVLGNGSKVKIDTSSRHILLYGGAGSVDNCQIMLESGSATIEAGVTNQGKDRQSLYFGNDGGGTYGDNEAAGHGAGISVGSGATLTVSVPVDGGDPMTKWGAGKLVLSNVASYTGTITLADGSLAVPAKLADDRVVPASGFKLKFDEVTKTYSLFTSVAQVGEGETAQYFATIEAAIEAAANATTAEVKPVITLTDPSAAAPAGFTKLEGGVLKACDYVVISPNAYVSDWQAYVTARQEMPAAEGLELGVKNATEIYDAYPYASANVNGDPRNAAESIHKWIGIMQKLGTKYFVLGGVWMDAQHPEWAANFKKGGAINYDTAIPGIVAKPLLGSTFAEYPSDLYFACHTLEGDAKYVWDSDANGVYLNASEAVSVATLTPQCVVSRMELVPWTYGASTLSYSELIQAYQTKLAAGENNSFSGNGKYITNIDFVKGYNATTGLPDIFETMRERMYSIVNVRTANELYIAPKNTKNPTLADEMTNRAMKENWEVSIPVGHGTPEILSYIDKDTIAQQTGLTKFVMANIPCQTGTLAAFLETGLEPGIAGWMLSNPTGGSLVSINNTFLGQLTNPGIEGRYVGISDEMLDHTLDSYVAGATAGEAWKTAISTYAAKILGPNKETELENRDCVGQLDYVISAIVEEMLFGDPLVAINERDVYVEDNNFTTFYTTKDKTQTTALRATDRIVFDKAAFDPTVAVDLTTAPTGHRIYFAPSTQGAPTAWKTTNGIPAGLQVLIGANTSFALYGQSAVNDGVIFSGEGTLTRTDSPDAPVDVTGLVQVYSAVSTPKARSMLFALASANAVLKVKEKLADGMVGGSIRISAMCNDFGDAGATYTATVEGDAPESMKTVVVPEGATKLCLLPSQTADLSAVNMASLSEIKVVMPNPYEETTIDMTALFDQNYNETTHILSLNLKESAAPAPEKLSVAMPGGKDEGKIEITIQNPIKGLCYSIVTADSPEGFAEDQIVDESERMQVMYAYSSIPLTLTYDPKKKVQYFKVRVSPSTKYGK